MPNQTLHCDCTIEKWPAKELAQADRDLLAAAHRAALNAYAPYSQFQVGAAARLENGEVVLGANQENMSYPQGMCGERIAVFTAGAQYPGVAIEAVAIVSPSPIANPNAFMPCGGCRQVLLESEQRQEGPIRLLLQARDEDVLVSKSATNLVPFAFDADGLGR
jgi:cytidine deaminase